MGAPSLSPLQGEFPNKESPEVFAGASTPGYSLATLRVAEAQIEPLEAETDHICPYFGRTQV